MRKSNFKILALTAALIMPLSSCKETIIYVTPEDTPNDDIKTPIELSVGGVDGAVKTSSTRAVITTEKTNMTSLTAGTHIFMLMKSEYDALTGDYESLNYGGAQAAKYTTTRGKVGSDDKVVFDDDATNTRTRYWDDAHARSSKLSIWALACDGLQYLGGTGTSLTETSYIFNTDKNSLLPWNTTAISATSLEWNIPNGSNSQLTNDDIKNRDLLFSNNLVNYSNNSGSDNRLKFDPTASPKFQGGKLVFYHAMSKIVINLNIGDGFTRTNDFKFSNGKNIQLNHFNIWGKFSVEQGEFTEVNKPYNSDGHASVMSIYNKTGNTPNYASSSHAYELEALVLPSSSTDTKTIKGSRFISGNKDAMMEFTIDGSIYKITSDALFNSLHADSDPSKSLVTNAVKKTDDGTYIPLEAGKKYVFTFTVSKTKIEHITASVVNWEEVVANEYTPIIDVNQNYGVADTKAFDKTYTFLRSTTKTGNYTTGSGATMTYADSKFTMAPQLYWPDHKTHYFFRGVYPAVGSTNGPSLVNDTENKTTTISVTNCAYAAGKSPSDLMIGIPRNSDGTDETCKVDGTGHKASSAQGICATSGNINLNFRYVMSQVEVRLKTTTDDAAVNLTNAKVEIVNGYTNGTIALSDGGATATGSTSDYVLNTVTTGSARDEIAIANIRHDAVVPQNLTFTTAGATTNLRFKITIYKAGSTTDIDDIYYADIKPIEVTVGSSPATTITSWEAGKHYIYTLNLKKTEIKVSATITDWVTATGSTNVWF